MNQYKILRTDVFNDQLTDIVLYIASNFSKKEAKDYLDYLENEIGKLSLFPLMGYVPRYQPISKQGYRALIARQNIIFYKVNEAKEEITLRIIVSAKRNYINLI